MKKILLTLLSITIAVTCTTATVLSEESPPGVTISSADIKPTPLPKSKAFEHFNKGSKLQTIKKFGEAAKEYQEALDSGLELWQAYYNCGVCHEQAGKYKKAYSKLIRAHKLNPKNFMICKHLSFVCHKLNRKEEAKGWLGRYNSL